MSSAGQERYLGKGRINTVNLTLKPALWIGLNINYVSLYDCGTQSVALIYSSETSVTFNGLHDQKTLLFIKKGRRESGCQTETGSESLLISRIRILQQLRLNVQFSLSYCRIIYIRLFYLVSHYIFLLVRSRCVDK